MIIIISLNRFIKQPFFLNINLQKTFYNFRHTMWRFLHWVSDNGLHLRRPTAYRKPLMPGHPLGGLMRRPTRLADGCGQKRPHALLAEPCILLALYANALLKDVGRPAIQRATGRRTLKSSL
jgi:hypothetical protein